MDVLSPGQLLLHFKIEQKIGQGGMGSVYLATDERLHRQVAIKVVSPALLQDESALRRFRNEAAALSRINHPNIATLYDFASAEGLDFLVMEYVTGRSLDELLLAAPLDEVEVVSYGVQLLDGLAAAHKLGILHRDLKPANLRVTDDGRLKILDFGLAKILDEDKQETALTQSGPGSALGTAPYLAPERLRGVHEAAGDLYAVGAVLYELAAGRKAFPQTTPGELIDAILHSEPESLRTVRASVSPGLEAIVSKALRKNPAQRYRSEAEMKAALEVLHSRAPSVEPGAARRKRVVGIAFAVLLACCVAAAMLLLNRRDPTQAKSGTTSRGNRPSANADANDAFQRGLVLITKQANVPKSRELFERALASDPHFALARGWYGFTDILMIDTGLSNDASWLYKAEQEIRRGLEDDPDSARCHSALAAFYWYQGRGDLVEKESAFALKLEPDELDAHIWRGLKFQLEGDYERAQLENQQITQRDPTFFPGRMNYADNLRQLGQTDAAIAELQKVLDVDPVNIYAIGYVALTHLYRGDAAAARRALESASPADRTNFELRQPWALLYAYEHRELDARKEMDEELQKFTTLIPNQIVYGAEFYSLLGDKKAALDWLDRAVRAGDARAAWFERDPLLANVREEQHFKDIVSSLRYRAHR